jgi:hypothetical protein
VSQYTTLIVERMPEGGFVVTEGGFLRDPSRYSPPLFAATTICDALAFVQAKLAPEATDAQRSNGRAPLKEYSTACGNDKWMV